MKSRIASAVLVLLLTITMLTFEVRQVEGQGPIMDVLLIEYYGSPDALFSALISGEVDFMDYPLTYYQYQEAINNPDIITGFYDENSYISLDLNNNYSLPWTTWRSPTNYTEFRQAIAYLLDKDALIAYPPLYGFATRIDTPVPRPIQNSWVNFEVSKYGPNGEWLNNYPWDYNPVKAAQILDAAGFVQGTTPNPDYDPSLPWSAQYLRVYPLGHEKAGQDLDPLIVYVRYDDETLKNLGHDVVENLRKIGIPIASYVVPFNALYGPVFVERNYHIFTNELILEAPAPMHLFELYHSSFIGPEGPNVIQYSDPELDQLLVDFMHATDGTTAEQKADEAQRIIVERVPNVPVATRKGVYAYRKGIANAVNQEGRGVINKLTLANSYHVSYPTVRQLRVGTLTPSHQNIIKEKKEGFFAKPVRILKGIIDIFEKGLEWTKRRFACPTGFSFETYKVITKTETFKDYKIETITKQEIIIKIKVGNSTEFWHDMVPLTINDFVFTLDYFAVGNIWFEIWEDIIGLYNCTIVDDYTADLYFNTTSIWIPYIIGNLEIIPKHIFETIDPSEASSGYYPADLPPSNVLIGSGPWQFVEEVQGTGGHMLLHANRNYYTTPVLGEIDYLYNWDRGYYAVALPDLVLLANAYSSSGTGEPSKNWDPSCDLAAPTGIIGLSDLVVLAKNYGRKYP
jgi:ABC-type transport system substrate-binding protein